MGLKEVGQLAGRGDYILAAEEALEVFEGRLSFGFRMQAFDALGAAAKFYHMGGNCRRSLDCFLRLFDTFEHDVTSLPKVSLALRWMANWPELYARAAFAAIDAGDPKLAISFAETGRCRATGHRLGPGAHQIPEDVSLELWQRYIKDWRLVVAKVANDLIDPNSRNRQEIRRLERELDELHSELENRGVCVEILRPINVPADIDRAINLLSRCEHPTAVLYSIRLHDRLRFVRVTGEGATPLVLAETEQATILEAADTYLVHLREITEARLDPERMARQVGDEVNLLVERVSTPLTPILEVARYGNIARVLWIPHHNLAVIPLTACGDGPLVEHVAVVVAPSMTMGMAALEPDITVPVRSRSIRGVEDHILLEGGTNLVRIVDPAPMSEATPRTIGEIQQMLSGVSLGHVTCHGVYDWQDPLSSYLGLGDQEMLTVEVILTDLILDPLTLLLFGTCDSGTIVQSDINEPVGVPTALLVAGCHTVLGSSWPVKKLAALGICFGFLKEISRGTSSPEAIQRASRWLRNAKLSELRTALQEIDHPLAGSVPEESPELQELLTLPSFWASYIHWGGGWRLAQSGE